MSKLERRFWRLDNAAMWGTLATGVLVSVAGAALWADSCEIAGAGVETCVSKWTQLLNAPPNEIGDALAGFAGALAFIWIVVTVAMQSEQLKAQREELALTRQEMKEQREATQDMARSMKAQAEIFEDEKDKRDRDAADKLVAQILLSIDIKLRGAQFQALTWAREIGKNSTPWDDNGERRLAFYLPRGVRIEDYLSKYVSNLSGDVQALKSEIEKEPYNARPACPSDRIEDVVASINSILNLYGDLSSDFLEALSRVPLRSLADLLMDLKSADIWRPEHDK